jgi:tRNA U34 5-methylaminomethyl-2-thiouridine-forming methyltransferase MnmC
VKREIITTADGSMSIRIPEMDENYHSSHGALQEAKHVFIEHGLRAILEKKNIRIFEMGFGTGLNALLSAQEAIHLKKHIHYTGIEAFPVSVDMALSMNYEKFVAADVEAVFPALHLTEWGIAQHISPFFTLEKIQQKIEDYLPKAASIDLVYFDAFGPSAQADMWNVNVLEKMVDLLVPGGLFVTYCAKGQLKRDLKSLGFTVESLPGPPGKREMTRAWKDK